MTHTQAHQEPKREDKGAREEKTAGAFTLWPIFRFAIRKRKTEIRIQS
jgi:hypothetical protein